MEHGKIEFWDVVFNLCKDLSVCVRVKSYDGDAPEEWSSWIKSPSEAYIDSAGGPMHKDEVEWVEINGRQTQSRGRLVPDLIIDRSSEIREMLNAAGLRWRFSGENVVRLQLSEQKHA